MKKLAILLLALSFGGAMVGCQQADDTGTGTGNGSGTTTNGSADGSGGDDTNGGGAEE